MFEDIKNELKDATRCLEEFSNNQDNLHLIQNVGAKSSIELNTYFQKIQQEKRKQQREEAEKIDIEISDPEAREHVYGMPYSEWKEKYIK